MRGLGRQPMVVERGKQTDDPVGDTFARLGHTVMFRQFCIGKAIEAAPVLHEKTALHHPPKVNPRYVLMSQIARPQDAHSLDDIQDCRRGPMRRYVPFRHHL